MSELQLAVSAREIVGKKVSKLRKEGFVPAVLDRPGEDSVNLQIHTDDLKKILHTEAGMNVLVDLEIKDGPIDKATAVIKHIQKNPISQTISHVDFHAIKMDEKLVTRVPVIIAGNDKKLRDMGGQLEQEEHEVDVRSLPNQIPAHVVVDVTELEVGHHMNASQITLPDGVEIVTDPETVIVVGRMIQDLSTEPEETEEAAAETAEAPEKSE